jgi:hypothetical protein
MAIQIPCQYMATEYLLCGALSCKENLNSSMPSMIEITRRSRERAALALSLRRQGKLLREIGDELGVGVERARSLVAMGESYERRRAGKRR